MAGTPAYNYGKAIIAMVGGKSFEEAANEAGIPEKNLKIVYRRECWDTLIKRGIQIKTISHATDTTTYASQDANRKRGMAEIERMRDDVINDLTDLLKEIRDKKTSKDDKRSLRSQFKTMIDAWRAILSEAREATCDPGVAFMGEKDNRTMNVNTVFYIPQEIADAVQPPKQINGINGYNGKNGH